MNEEQAVLVELKGSSSPSDLADIEDALVNTLSKQAVGKFDGNGNEIGPTETTLYLYGPDANALFLAIKPTLGENKIARGARVIVRYGAPGAPQKEVTILGSRLS